MDRKKERIFDSIDTVFVYNYYYNILAASVIVHLPAPLHASALRSSTPALLYFQSAQSAHCAVNDALDHTFKHRIQVNTRVAFFSTYDFSAVKFLVVFGGFQCVQLC